MRTSVPTKATSSSATASSERSAEQLSIDQKSRTLGEFVVQDHRRGIRFVRLPVDAWHLVAARAFVYRFDQCAPDAAAARTGVGEQVLQITARRDLDGAAMEQVV